MLKISDLTVRYGFKTALDDVTLHVDKGSVVGIVGPNGAGKSTLFGSIIGTIPVHSGSITLDDEPISDIPSKDIGYLGESPFQFDFFTPIETLLFERSMRDPNVPSDRISSLLDQLDLSQFLSTPVGKLSQGLKKRVAIAAAFASEPALLVLDEPLNAIDIQTVIILKNLVREAASRGSHVLISSHILDFFDGLIEKVVFLDHGSIRHVSDNDSIGAEETYKRLFMSK